MVKLTFLTAFNSELFDSEQMWPDRAESTLASCSHDQWHTQLCRGLSVFSACIDIWLWKFIQMIVINYSVFQTFNLFMPFAIMLFNLTKTLSIEI